MAFAQILDYGDYDRCSALGEKHSSRHASADDDHTGFTENPDSTVEHDSIVLAEIGKDYHAPVFHIPLRPGHFHEHCSGLPLSLVLRARRLRLLPAGQLLHAPAVGDRRPAADGRAGGAAEEAVELSRILFSFLASSARLPGGHVQVALSNPF